MDGFLCTIASYAGEWTKEYKHTGFFSLIGRGSTVAFLANARTVNNIGQV